MSIYNLKLRTKKYPRRERPPSSMRYHQGPNRSMQKKASWCINRYSAKRGGLSYLHNISMGVIARPL